MSQGKSLFVSRPLCKKKKHFVLHVDYVTFIIPLCLFDSMSDTIDCCKGIVDMSTHIRVNLLGSHWSYPLSLNHISILWPVLIVANYPVTPPHSLQALGRSHKFCPLKIKSTYSSNSQIFFIRWKCEVTNVSARVLLTNIVIQRKRPWSIDNMWSTMSL